MSSGAFDAREQRAVACVLDVLVPADEARGRLGAGALGLGPAALARAIDAAPFIREGLAWLDAAARAAGAADFEALGAASRQSLLEQLTNEGHSLVPSLLFHVYSLYYQHPRVLESLGLPGRPPHPEGYTLEAGDLSSLERVRARGPLYRR